MKAIIICYSLGKANHSIRSKLKRELYGYTDKSNRGRYIYKREGILQKIPHLKPTRGVIIVPAEYADRILDVLKVYKAQIKTYEIMINQKKLTPA